MRGMKKFTIKIAKSQRHLNIQRNRKRLVLVTADEKPHHFIMIEMQEKSDWIQQDNQTFIKRRTILIRRKNLSVMSGMHMLRLYGNAAVAYTT